MKISNLYPNIVCLCSNLFYLKINCLSLGIEIIHWNLTVTGSKRIGFDDSTFLLSPRFPMRVVSACVHDLARLATVGLNLPAVGKLDRIHCRWSPLGRGEIVGTVTVKITTQSHHLQTFNILKEWGMYKSYCTVMLSSNSFWSLLTRVCTDYWDMYKYEFSSTILQICLHVVFALLTLAGTKICMNPVLQLCKNY